MNLIRTGGHHMKNHEKNWMAQVMRVVAMSGLFAGCLLSSLVTHAAVNFQFEYVDDPGTGFLDPVHGASRQAALNTAGSTFSTMFGNHFTNAGTVVLEARATNNPNSGELAAAAGELVGSGLPGFNLGEVVRTKLQTGVDLNGNRADGSVDINFGNEWELDFNKPASNAQYDFYSTLFHEFTHTLGFASSIGEFGDPVFGSASAGSWNTFDRFIVDKNGTRIIDPASFAINQTRWNEGSVGGAGPAEGLFFDGANAVAANGGRVVSLYTPEIWEEGSSISHLDSQDPAYANMMMLPTSSTGPYARDYSPVEAGILQDLGYTAVIPEPEVYSMMLVGLSLLGWAARRKV
jgi:hypothetical protein